MQDEVVRIAKLGDDFAVLDASMFSEDGQLDEARFQRERDRYEFLKNDYEQSRLALRARGDALNDAESELSLLLHITAKPPVRRRDYQIRSLLGKIDIPGQEDQFAEALNHLVVKLQEDMRFELRAAGSVGPTLFAHAIYSTWWRIFAVRPTIPPW